MGNIGSTELLVIFILALLLLGPRRLPEVGEALGRTLRKFRQASRELREEMDVRRDVDIRRDLDSMDKTEKPAAPRDTQSRGALSTNQKIDVEPRSDATAQSTSSEQAAATQPPAGAGPPQAPPPSESDRTPAPDGRESASS